MVLAALSVVYINDDQTRRTAEAQMTEAYTVWKTDSSSTGRNVALSFANSFVLVLAICAMTFVIVLLYKMRCMTFLIGYMILASATLLGVLGGNMLNVAVEVYQSSIDKLSFYGFLYNFAVVGVLAVFWGKGIPTYVSQGYLIATSVILAWQLANFDEWTTWSLLIMLSLYDLCAVLTPCGPLRALVNLMSREDSPDMPMLLYEAELPPEARRPGTPQAPPSRPNPTSDVASPTSEQAIDGNPSRDVVFDDRSTLPSEATVDSDTTGGPAGIGPIVKVPLAIARVYNLPIVRDPSQSNGANDTPLLGDDIREEPTAQELQAEVCVQLPAQGGRIERTSRGKMFLERDRFGNPKRTLWVDRQGKVFAEEAGDDDDDDGKDSNSIRLGLGDFIFYSVLVAKAATHSFATFVACMLVILAGLGSTLILLAVYHHALPALPISIFLGITFYLVTRALIEPWIAAILSQPFYV